MLGKYRENDEKWCEMSEYEGWKCEKTGKKWIIIRCERGKSGQRGIKVGGEKDEKGIKREF